MTCKRRGCRHARRMCGTWLGEAWDEWAPSMNAIAPDRLVCLDCGAWLPLGPSDDTGCEVEIRAAELAILSVERRASAPIEWCSIQEWFGFDAADDIGEGYLAGYLARCIVDHSATEREGRR